MGPGTHVSERVRKGVNPTNFVDMMAMVHDINYLLANGDRDLLFKADAIAVTRALGHEGSTLMTLGLTARTVLGLPQQGDLNEGLYLKQLILNDDRYTDYISDKDFVK